MLYSVIIPVYNVERYIRDCVASVVAQTYPDWEIILVDDGSIDSSPLICDELACELGERACVVHQDNAGPLAARRAGLRVARGDVFMSLDSDDALRPDAIERIDAVFCEHDVDVVAFGYSRKRDFSSMVEGPYDSSCHVSRVEFARRTCLLPTLNSMWAKAVLGKCMDVDTDYSRFYGLSYAEDLLQTLPIVDAMRGAYYINEPIYYYRRNDNGLTRRFDLRQLSARDIVHAIHLEYAEKWAQEMSSPNLVDAVHSMGLNSYAEISQGVCEVLSKEEALAYLDRFSHEQLFREYYNFSGCMDSFRSDRKLILRLLARERFGLIWMLTKLKVSLRTIIGR